MVQPFKLREEATRQRSAVIWLHTQTELKLDGGAAQECCVLKGLWVKEGEICSVTRRVSGSDIPGVREGAKQRRKDTRR